MYRSGVASISLVGGEKARAAEQQPCFYETQSPNAPNEKYAVEFGRFLDQTQGVVHSQQLFDLLAALARKFDCSWIAYSPLISSRKILEPRCQDCPSMLNYPDAWKKRYSDMGYYRIDPIIKKIRQSVSALRWKDVYNDVSTTVDERRIFDEASIYGLKSGITVPLRGPNGNFAMISFAQRSTSELPSRVVTLLHLSALHFHIRLGALRSYGCIENEPELSLREKDCILWVARGKSSWDVGRILGISENTVKFHIKKAMYKLDCTSRTVAVVKALKLGIIDI
ncbi:LuxR family transcriptional regulator [Ensifer sp. BR816]|uniref:LuxR family transcriptional regulator n=1 Tax=Rhizobium sp. (strain BR816) TaxID=1057002 RepID=UPI000365BCA9|nr:LuxR family transcriptional regulator [Ensifer sp. BR816]